MAAKILTHSLLAVLIQKKMLGTSIGQLRLRCLYIKSVMFLIWFEHAADE